MTELVLWKRRGLGILSTSMLSNVYQCFQSKSQTFMNFKSSINIVFSTTFPLKSDVYRRCVKKDFSMYLVFCIFGWSCTGTTPLNDAAPHEQTKQNLKPLSKFLNQLNVWSRGHKGHIYWYRLNKCKLVDCFSFKYVPTYWPKGHYGIVLQCKSPLWSWWLDRWEARISSLKTAFLIPIKQSNVSQTWQQLCTYLIFFSAIWVAFVF